MSAILAPSASSPEYRIDGAGVLGPAEFTQDLLVARHRFLEQACRESPSLGNLEYANVERGCLSRLATQMQDGAVERRSGIIEINGTLQPYLLEGRGVPCLVIGPAFF